MCVRARRSQCSSTESARCHPLNLYKQQMRVNDTRMSCFRGYPGKSAVMSGVGTLTGVDDNTKTIKQQESLADAKVSTRQQCVYEDP